MRPARIQRLSLLHEAEPAIVQVRDVPVLLDRVGADEAPQLFVRGVSGGELADQRVVDLLLHEARLLRLLHPVDAPGERGLFGVHVADLLALLEVLERILCGIEARSLVTQRRRDELTLRARVRALHLARHLRVLARDRVRDIANQRRLGAEIRDLDDVRLRKNLRADRLTNIGRSRRRSEESRATRSVRESMAVRAPRIERRRRRWRFRTVRLHNESRPTLSVYARSLNVTRRSPGGAVESTMGGTPTEQIVALETRRLDDSEAQA